MKFANWMSSVAACVVLVLASSPVNAETDHGRPAGYVGIGLAHSWPEFGSGNFDPAYGFNARGGYRFLPYLAAELNVDFANQFSDTIGIRDTPTTELKTRVLATTANIKAILPMGWFRPYLLGGIGFQLSQLRVEVAGVEDSDHDYRFVGRVAGGFDIMLHDQIGWHVEGFALLPAGTSDFEVYGWPGAIGPLRTVGLNTGIRFVF